MLLNFDYDGVIVDSFDQLLSLAVRAQQEIGIGRAPTAEDFRTLENLSCEGVCGLVGIPDDMVAEYSETLFKIQAGDWQVDVFAEMVSVLKKLAESNTLVIITSSGSKIVEETLAETELAGVFSTIMGGDLGLDKVQRIARAMRDFDTPKEQSFMIGDSIGDIRQGKKAGVKTIAVTWGFQPRNILEAESPDFIVGRAEDLLEIPGVRS